MPIEFIKDQFRTRTPLRGAEVIYADKRIDVQEYEEGGYAIRIASRRGATPVVMLLSDTGFALLSHAIRAMNTEIEPGEAVTFTPRGHHFDGDFLMPNQYRTYSNGT